MPAAHSSVFEGRPGAGEVPGRRVGGSLVPPPGGRTFVPRVDSLRIGERQMQHDTPPPGLLPDAGNGKDALDRAIPSLYAELRALAHRRLRQSANERLMVECQAREGRVRGRGAGRRCG